MKITSIETFSTDNISFVRVKTDDGYEGWGQVAPYFANITALILHKQIAPAMIGTEIHHSSEISEFAEKHILSHYKFAWSYICRAVGGVETALWDLFGKKERKSVSELLGGKPKAIPVYGSSMRRDISPQDEAARILTLKDNCGFGAFKIRIGTGFGKNEDVYPGRSEENVKLVRKAIGNETKLYVDANSAYTPEKAIEIGRMLESFGICHYEEPCPFPELEWTKMVTDAMPMNVTGGEQDNDMAQWRRIINMRAVNIVQPDICYIGGISRALEVARIARGAGMVCTPHAANLSMVTIFTAHLVAAIPNAGEFMEFSIEDTPFCDGLFTESLEIKDGAFHLSAEPGWGVTIQPDWLNKAEYSITQ